MSAEDLLAFQLTAVGIEFERQYYYSPPRRLRADFAFLRPIGAGHLAAVSAAPPQRWDRSASYRRGGEAPRPSAALRDDALLAYLRERGRATSNDAALHFVRSRDTMADRFGALERAGKITRFKGQARTLIWEAL